MTGKLHLFLAALSVAVGSAAAAPAVSCSPSESPPTPMHALWEEQVLSIAAADSTRRKVSLASFASPQVSYEPASGTADGGSFTQASLGRLTRAFQSTSTIERETRRSSGAANQCTV